MMGIIFYDLKGRDGRNFSPYCWRTRMALAHKGLNFEHRGTAFTEIKDVVNGKFKTVPVIENNGEAICDSNEIAKYLETHFSDHPSLFGGNAGEALCKFVHSWTNAVVHPGVARSVIFDIYDHI